MPAAEQAPAALGRMGFPDGKHIMSLLLLSWPPWSSSGTKLSYYTVPWQGGKAFLPGWGWRSFQYHLNETIT